MKNNLPEALVVWFTNYTSPDGFEESMTLRGNTMKDVLEQRKDFIAKLKEIGATPIIRNRGFQKKEIEYVPDKVCPVDSGRLKVIVSKKDGKTYWACEHGRYDWNTKTTIGCKFICSPETFERRVAELSDPIMDATNYIA